jgi:DNA-binding MarR family transcriptional regulator
MADYLVRLDKKAGTLSVLVALQGTEGLPMSQLCRLIRLERATTASAVQILKDIGLVERRQSLEFPFRKVVSLTDFGLRLVSQPVLRWRSLLVTAETGLSSRSYGERGRYSPASVQSPRAGRIAIETAQTK